MLKHKYRRRGACAGEQVERGDVLVGESGMRATVLGSRLLGCTLGMIDDMTGASKTGDSRNLHWIRTRITFGRTFPAEQASQTKIYMYYISV